jgi:hypothetical protein
MFFHLCIEFAKEGGIEGGEGGREGGEGGREEGGKEGRKEISQYSILNFVLSNLMYFPG